MGERETTGIVNCPECHRECGWCSWYAKNARQVGCSSNSKKKCDWGEQLKGTTCELCGGDEVVRCVSSYTRIVSTGTHHG